MPSLLGMVLGQMTEINFCRALMISNGSPSIFFGSVFCWVFIILIAVVLLTVAIGKIKESKAAKATEEV